MQRLYGFPNSEHSSPFRSGCVVSVGNFDGVHLGHRQILQELVSQARKRSVPAAVLTFEPHPAASLSPGRLPPRLTTADQKAQLLEAIGIDLLVEYPTDRELLSLSPAAFFNEIVQTKLRARAMIEGPNFLFGVNRAGNVQILDEFCQAAGIQLKVLQPQLIGDADRLISSSEIRQAILKGDVESAANWLGRPYSITGHVVEGERRGRTIGFPTANLAEIQTLLPGHGVYAAKTILHGQTYPVALHLGPNPTFEVSTIKVEAHILGFSGDLYGQLMSVEFLAKIRDLKKFEGLGELQHQLGIDVARVLRFFDDAEI